MMRRNGQPGRNGRAQYCRAAAALLVSSLFWTVAWAGVSSPRPEVGAVSKSAADDLAAKIAVLSGHPARPSGPLDPITITDREANSYLRYRGHEFLPPALHDPEVHIMGGHLSGAANVNFDELGGMQSKSDDLTSKMMAYVFKGTQRVTATGTLKSQDGQGTFALTSLTVGKTSLPPAFVTFLLQSYIEKQYKVDINKPFSLPAGVNRIELTPGRATFRRVALSRR